MSQPSQISPFNASFSSSSPAFLPEMCSGPQYCKGCYELTCCRVCRNSERDCSQHGQECCKAQNACVCAPMGAIVGTSALAHPDVIYPLRRSNATPCTCGTCRSCCHDLLFWHVVMAHRDRIAEVRAGAVARNAHNPERYPLEDIPDCDCVFCDRAGINEVPHNLPPLPEPRGPTHLRRSNNCECTCMCCASCVSDTVYFSVVEAHRWHVEAMRELVARWPGAQAVRECDCLYCEAEKRWGERMRM